MVDSDYPIENRLWQMAKASAAGTLPGQSARGPSTSCPDAMDLSAWLDGRADEQAANQIELHLTSCPACIDAIGELRVVLAQDGQRRAAAPRIVLYHAKALGANRRPATVPSVLAWPHWAVGATRWAAAAMVLLAITYGGFRGGLQTSMYLDQRSAVSANQNAADATETAAALHAKETAALAKEGPFGLGQTDTTDQDELLAMAEAD
jgi:anti-sigma factor RsiW